MIGLLTFLLYLLIYACIAYIVVWVILKVAATFVQVPPAVTQLLYVIAGILILIWAIQHFPAAVLP